MFYYSSCSTPSAFLNIKTNGWSVPLHSLLSEVESLWKLLNLEKLDPSRNLTLHAGDSYRKGNKRADN